MARIELGDKVTDTVSGMIGIAISRTEYLHGCMRIGVQAQETKDGKPTDAIWIDEPQLDVVGRAVVRRFDMIGASSAPARNAGPREDASRAPDPVR